MSPTFAELGIPFPLFEAPVEEARGYFGRGVCSLCRIEQACCFKLGLGAASVVAACAVCGEANALPVDHALSVPRKLGSPCRRCGGTIPFPSLEGQPPLACYGCLRTGRAVYVHNTALGAVLPGALLPDAEFWEGVAEGGATDGRPGMTRPDFEFVPFHDGRLGARVSVPHLVELLGTPSYSTIQGEQWQFHCRQPMVYLGPWTPQDFWRHAPDGDGRALFNKVVQDAEWLPEVLWDGKGEVWDTYIFRCAVCGQLAGHWDVA